MLGAKSKRFRFNIITLLMISFILIAMRYKLNYINQTAKKKEDKEIGEYDQGIFATPKTCRRVVFSVEFRRFTRRKMPFAAFTPPLIFDSHSLCSQLE